MYFFVMNSLDKGMDQTSRLVRTGQAQKTNMTVNDFKQNICNSAGGWIKCNKVQVFVQKYPGLAVGHAAEVPERRWIGCHQSTPAAPIQIATVLR